MNTKTNKALKPFVLYFEVSFIIMDKYHVLCMKFCEVIQGCGEIAIHILPIITYVAIQLDFFD